MGGSHSQFTEEELKEYQVSTCYLQAHLAAVKSLYSLFVCNCAVDPRTSLFA